MNVNLHIERLILEGLTLQPGEHLQVRVAAESELSRLLAAQSWGQSFKEGGAVARLSGGDIQLADGTSPQQIGQQIGRAVFGGINR
jgi:hypothetical protein